MQKLYEYFRTWRTSYFLNETVSTDYLALFVDARHSVVRLLLYNTTIMERLFYNSQPGLPDPETVATKGGVVAMIGLRDTNDGGHGPCMNAMEVVQSAVGPHYQGKGYGKLIYGLAMAWAARKNIPITPDRTSTSKSAENVWQSIAKSAKVLPPLEDRYASNTNGKPLGSFDDIDNPDTNAPEDDCTLVSQPWLNRAYTSNNEDQNLRHFMAKHSNFAAKTAKNMEFTGNDVSAILSVLSDAADEFFNVVYYGYR